MCGLPTGLRAPCGQGSAGSAGRGVLQGAIGCEPAGHMHPLANVGGHFHPLPNVGGARLLPAGCGGLAEGLRPRGGFGQKLRLRGGRRMTQSSVMGLPQQGQVGAGGGVGVGLGAACVPRIWCRRSRFLFAAALSHP